MPSDASDINIYGIQVAFIDLVSDWWTDCRLTTFCITMWTTYKWWDINPESMTFQWLIWGLADMVRRMLCPDVR